MTTNPFRLLQHSLGHTRTGKLIMEFTGNIAQFRTAHLKWNAADHFEAAELLNKLAKRPTTRKREFVQLLSNIHKEEGNYKKQHKKVSA